MADPAPVITDDQIADSIRTQLAARASDGATGIISVTIDGVTTQFSEPEARKALDYWEARAKRASGKRRRIYTMDLRGAY